MSQDRRPRKRAMPQLPIVLLGMPDPARTALLVHALQRRGLHSVIALDGEDVQQQLGMPEAAQIALVILDAALTSARGRFADLIADSRRLTSAPILTLGGTALGQSLGDFDLPPDADNELIAANAQALARRERPQEMTIWGPWRVDLATWQASWQSVALSLSNAQFPLIHALVAAHGATVDRQTLARLIYDDAPVNGDALRAHMTRLRHRLRQAAPAAAKALITVRGKGYRLTDDRTPHESNSP